MLLEELPLLCMLLLLLLPDSFASTSEGNISLLNSSSLSQNSSYCLPLDSGVHTDTGVLCCGGGDAAGLKNSVGGGAAACSSCTGILSMFSSSSHHGGRRRRRSARLTVISHCWSPRAATTKRTGCGRIVQTTPSTNMSLLWRTHTLVPREISVTEGLASPITS